MMDKKLFLYGCGKTGVSWLEKIGAENVYGFIDSDTAKVGTVVCGKRVYSVKDSSALEKSAAIFITASRGYKFEIYRNLKRKNLDKLVVGYPLLNQNVYLHWDTYVGPDTEFEGRNAVQQGAQLDNCVVGFASYVSAYSMLYNTCIGRYTSIGPNVRIVSGQHPTRKFVSTHPIFYSTQQTIRKSYVSENLYEEYRHTKNNWTVEIGNDVWIGDGVTVMEGVSIADGTIVAAGANVVKDTEPYSIVGGNPARLIRYRFDREDIDLLEEVQWWNKGEKWIDEHAEYFDDIEKYKRNCL